MMAVDAETLTPISPPSVGRIGAVGTGIRVVHRSRGTVPVAPVVAVAVVAAGRVRLGRRVAALRRVVVRAVRSPLAFVGRVAAAGRVVAVPTRVGSVAPTVPTRVRAPAATAAAATADGPAADDRAAGEVVPAVEEDRVAAGPVELGHVPQASGVVFPDEPVGARPVDEVAVDRAEPGEEVPEPRGGVGTDPLDPLVVVDGAHRVGDVALGDEELQPLHHEEVADVVAGELGEVRLPATAASGEVVLADVLEAAGRLGRVAAGAPVRFGLRIGVGRLVEAVVLDATAERVVLEAVVGGLVVERV